MIHPQLQRSQGCDHPNSTKENRKDLNALHKYLVAAHTEPDLEGTMVCDDEDQKVVILWWHHFLKDPLG